MSKLYRFLHHDDVDIIPSLVCQIDSICDRSRRLFRRDCLLKGITPPRFRKHTFSTQYVLEKLLFLLKTGCTYREACHDSLRDHHYSMIFKRVKYWRSIGVFDTIFQQIRDHYVDNHLGKSSLDVLNIFVDGTNIRNKNGREQVDFGFKDHGKKGCRVTCGVDINRFPLVMSLSSSRGHDVTELPSIISQLDSIPNLKYKSLQAKINIVGDKGYIMDKAKIPVLKNIEVEIITPPKVYVWKNTKKEQRERKKGMIKLVKKKKTDKKKTDKKEYKVRVMTEEKKEILKKRAIIENTFATLKQFKRLANRYETKVTSFKALIKLGMILMGNRTISTLENQKAQKLGKKSGQKLGKKK